LNFIELFHSLHGAKSRFSYQIFAYYRTYYPNFEFISKHEFNVIFHRYSISTNKRKWWY